VRAPDPRASALRSLQNKPLHSTFGNSAFVISPPMGNAHHAPEMKLNLHRSMTFWFGILVMGFIAWAWWDSGRYQSAAVCRKIEIENFDDGVRISHNTDDYYQMVDSEGFDQWRYPAAILARKLKAGSLPRPHFERFDDQGSFPFVARPPGDWDLFLPHWLLLLEAALLWGALLAWRARRRWARTRMTNEVLEERC
jgi:hypothetical protein